MKPFETTLPARQVEVRKAEIWTNDQRHQLHLTLALGGITQKIALVGASLFELVGRLSVELGFSHADAAFIVQSAEHPKTALN